MRRVWKILRVVLIVLLIVILITPLAGWLWLRRSLLQVNGKVTVAGLSGAVDIVRDPTLLASILQGNEAVWCDDVLTPGADDCSATARIALDKALKDLTERMGKDLAKWRWGDIHKTQFPHNPFSQVAFLKPLFHRSIETGGDAFTVNPAPFKLANPYDSQHLPSYREIIDLADFGTARFIQTTGQAGNPLSKHYADLMPLWQAVEYVPMYGDQAQVKAEAEGTLVLEPK